MERLKICTACGLMCEDLKDKDGKVIKTIVDGDIWERNFEIENCEDRINGKTNDSQSYLSEEWRALYRPGSKTGRTLR